MWTHGSRSGSTCRQIRPTTVPTRFGKAAIIRPRAPPAGRRVSFLKGGSSGRGQSPPTDQKKPPHEVAKTRFGEAAIIRPRAPPAGRRVLSMYRNARVLWVPLQCPYSALTVPLQCPYSALMEITIVPLYFAYWKRRPGSSSLHIIRI